MQFLASDFRSFFYGMDWTVNDKGTIFFSFGLNCISDPNSSIYTHSVLILLIWITISFVGCEAYGSMVSKQKGHWFEPRCGHLKLCIVSLDKASKFINLQSGIKLHCFGLPAMSWCPIERGGGRVLKPLMRIFLYNYFYKPNYMIIKSYMSINNFYIC